MAAYKRSKLFYRTGSVLSVVAAAMFLAVFSSVFIETNFWKNTVFGNMESLANACSARTLLNGQPNTPWQKVTIPHYGMKLAPSPLPPDSVTGLEYRCHLPEQSGFSRAHLGWILGHAVQVKIGDEQTYRLQGPEKLVIPYQRATVVDISIVDSPEKINMIGFASNHPAVISTSYQQNMKIGGVHLLLMVLRSLNYGLPILSVGLLLGLAWFSGRKSRVLTMTLFMLGWVALHRGTYLFATLYEWDHLAISKLGIWLRMGFGVSIPLLFMEMERIKPKAIYPIARMTTAVLLLAMLTQYAMGWRFNDMPLVFGSRLLVMAATAWVTYVAFQRWRKGACRTISVVLFAVSTVLLVLDLSLGLAVISGFVVEIGLPFVVALLTIFDLSLFQKRFHKEAEKSKQLAIQNDVVRSAMKTLSRFLPEKLVERVVRFNGEDAAEDGIQDSVDTFIAPQEREVALIQADVRGFSQLVDACPPEQVTEFLRQIYSPAVDFAQKVSMTKLIGDCLFAFVPQEKGIYAADVAVEIAAHLIRSIDDFNRSDQYANELGFGIAINYGTAIVGNLSSQNCIDYTAIGSPVNLVARLEESTKQKAVAAAAGPNGVIMGPSVITHLNKYRDTPLGSVSRVEIRSFPEIDKIYYLRAKDCLRAVFSDADQEESYFHAA